MRFEIGESGELLITEITERANDHLWRLERNAWHEFNSGRDEVWQSWFLKKSSENEVTVKLTERYYLKKLVLILDELIAEYGLEVTLAAQTVIDGWKEQLRLEKERHEYERRADEARRARGILLDRIKRMILDGCKRCSHFKVRLFGDDCEGYCCANAGDPVRLESSPLRFEYGENVNGTQYMGQKYYPHKNCQILKEIEG